jgi:hypothetical protein
MDRSATTQSPFGMYDWMRPAAPSRCEVCGRTLTPTGTDWASQWYTNTYSPLMNNLKQMWTSMAQPWTAPAANPYSPLMDSLARMWSGMAQPWMTPGTSAAQPGRHPHAHHHHHHHDCGCEQGDCDGCRGDRCHCRCCITDADLVVYARVGERRVVPLIIENPRQRERQVKLELSNWSSRGGTAANVKAQIAGPAEFTLAACQEHETILLIEAATDTATGTQTPGTVEGKPIEVIDRNLPDVDDCRVFYADLRVEGCEMRPVRIAFALLPRDCAGFKVDCACSCC